MVETQSQYQERHFHPPSCYGMDGFGKASLDETCCKKVKSASVVKMGIWYLAATAQMRKSVFEP